MESTTDRPELNWDDIDLELTAAELLADLDPGLLVQTGSDPR